MQNFDEVVDVMPRIERCAACFDFLMVDRRFAEPFCGSFFSREGCGVTTWRGLEFGNKDIPQSILLLFTNASIPYHRLHIRGTEMPI